MQEGNVTKVTNNKKTNTVECWDTLRVVGGQQRAVEGSRGKQGAVEGSRGQQRVLMF